MPTLSVESPDIADMISESEPIVLNDVPGYFDHKVTFVDFQKMFEENRKELDEAVCKIEKNDEFEKISDFFAKIDERTMVERNISIEWYVSHMFLCNTRRYR